MPKLVVNKPNRPVGAPVGVPGLGLFANGQEHTVSPATAAAYEKRTGKSVPKLIGEPLKKEEAPPPAEPVTPAEMNQEEEVS